MIFFRPFFLPNVHDANTYIIGDSETKEAVLVDAGGYTAEYEWFLQEKQARLTGIFLTHLHWDHNSGVDEVLSNLGNVTIYSFNGQTPNGKAVQENDTIPIGNLNNQVLQTTGHTPHSISLVVENRMVFVGDALFAGSIGGTSSPSDKKEEMQNIQEKLFTLPDETLICPGHGPMTTVGIEKTANPFFK